MPKPPTPTRKPPGQNAPVVKVTIPAGATQATAPQTVPGPVPSPGSDAGLAARLADVRARIADACARVKRPVEDVTLIAVTKSATVEQVRELVALGVSDLGENRVPQLVARAAAISDWHGGQGGRQGLPPRVKWHMIGHLQRNKVKPLLPVVTAIHAVDSLRLAEEIDVQAAKLGKRIPVMLQLNASEEPQKYGVAVGAAVHLGEQVATMPNLQLVGLMTMAAFGADEATTRFTFSRTREVFEEMRWHKFGGGAFKHLSMGMSGDFEIAIEEGATLVRIGSTLLGTAARESDDFGSEE